MRLSRRLSILTGVVLAACGGATTLEPSDNDAGSGPRDAGTRDAAKDTGPTDCPHTVVLKTFTRELGQAELCTLEQNGALYGGRYVWPEVVTLDSESCTAICGDPKVNYCVLPSASYETYAEIYPNGYAQPSDGGADAGVCPFVETVGAQTLSCQQWESRGTYQPGCPVEGRRPEGYEARGSHDHTSSIVGVYLAECAHLEAASVVAFEDLAKELAAHGAPADLIEACLDAAAEEVAHADVVGALARDHGGIVVPVDLPPRRSEARALIDIAIDNAVEGCVRELFGAVQAHARAARATDASVRAAMFRIAEDESRHAELSARIGEFLDSRLDSGERERVREAAAAARVELRDELARGETHPTLARVAGVPTREIALALFDALEREVWLSVA